MKCKKCGAENAEGAKFCISCGTPLTEPIRLPEAFKPISMWGYFGYELLFSIPIVGLLFLLLFSFGATKNVNLRNFARSYFCFLIVLLVVSCVLLAAGLGAALTAGLLPVSAPM